MNPNEKPRSRKLISWVLVGLVVIAIAVFLVAKFRSGGSPEFTYNIEDVYLLMIADKDGVRQKLLTAPRIKSIEMVGGDSRVAHEEDVPYVIYFRDLTQAGPGALNSKVQAGYAYLAYDTTNKTYFARMKAIDVKASDDEVGRQVGHYIAWQIKLKRTGGK
jgi:hypothetical protein